MTRDEHLAWAKARALEYWAEGDLANAVASMASDLSKHSELAFAANVSIVLYVQESDREGVKRWIEGFR